MVPNPGNTRCRITQFKHTLYLYFLMKSMLGKAMEQISMGMALTLQGLPNYRKDMEKILFQLHKQDIRMDHIDHHIPCIIELYGMPKATIEDPALVASDSEEQNVKKDQFLYDQFLFMRIAFKFLIVYVRCYIVFGHETETSRALLERLKQFCFCMAYNVDQWPTDSVSPRGGLKPPGKIVWCKFALYI